MSAEQGGNDRDYVQSIERGFAVLLAFDAELPTASLAEVAARTRLSRPAVRRILLTLQRLGYVANSGARWSLTPRVLTIGQHFAATHGVVETAQPRIAPRIMKAVPMPPTNPRHWPNWTAPMSSTSPVFRCAV